MKKISLPFFCAFTFLCSCVNNPEVTDYIISDTDTLAVLYIPKHSTSIGVFVIWDSDSLPPSKSIQDMCSRSLNSEKCIRTLDSKTVPERKPNLYVFKRDKNIANIEKYVDRNDFEYIYYPIGLATRGKVISKKELQLKQICELATNLKFYVNGKEVIVSSSTERYVNLYTPKQLSEEEAICIYDLLQKYGHEFRLQLGNGRSEWINGKKRILYFLLSDIKESAGGSEDNYMTIIDKSFYNLSTNKSKTIYDIEWNIRALDELDDLFTINE